MTSLKAKLGILVAGLMLSGCMQTASYQAAPEATLKPADKVQLEKARYAKVAVAEPFRRAIVDYHRKEMSGSIVIHSAMLPILAMPEKASASSPTVMP